MTEEHQTPYDPDQPGLLPDDEPAPQGPKKTSSLAKSSAIMASGTLLSRILGFVKSALLAIAIGNTVGAIGNSFDVANKVPNILYMLIGGGILNAVLVPQIVRATKRPDGGKDFVNRLLTLSIGVLVVITAVATVCAPLLVRLYTSGWSSEQLALATAFAYWCLPQILFYGIYTLLGQVLNAKESFGPYMWAPVLNNVIAIAGLLTFIVMFGPFSSDQHDLGTWTPTQITILAGSATLGVFAQALILLIPLRTIGFKFRPTFGFRGVGLGTAGKIAGWTFAATLIGQLGFVVTSRVSSTASSDGNDAVASLAAYTSSYSLFMVPHSLVAVSLVTALFTTLSRSAAKNDTYAIRASFAQGMRLVGLLNVFFTVAIVALAPPVAMIIAPGSSEQANAIGAVITAMIVGLVPFSANYLVQRVFYAYEDAKTPFWIQTIQTVVTTIGVLASGTLLDKQLIVAGIGLSMSFGYTVACLLGLLLLRRRLGRIGFKAIFIAHLKFAVAGVVALAAGYMAYRLFDPERALSGWIPAFLTAAVIGVLMLAIYLIICMALRVGELNSLLGVLRRKLGRGSRSAATAPTPAETARQTMDAEAADPSTPPEPVVPNDPEHRVREGYDVPTQALDIVDEGQYRPRQSRSAEQSHDERQSQDRPGPSRPRQQDGRDPDGPDDEGTRTRRPRH